MNILEKEIEDVVYHTAKEDHTKLLKRGLNLATFSRNSQPLVLRQVQLWRYGIIDILSILYIPDRKLYIIDIIELKKDYVNYDTFNQSLKYKKGIQTLFSNHYPCCNYTVNINLIGKGIGLDDNLCFIPDLFDGISIYTFNIDLENGLTFTGVSDYNLTNHGVNNIDSSIESLIKTHVLNQYRYGKKVH